MSSSVQAPSSSTQAPNFQPIFEKALKQYKKKTGKSLTAHELAAEIERCNSPEDILTVLEGKANELKQSRRGDERLSKWLNPTVNILNALSATLGEGAGMVFPPTTIIFSGISILLVAAKSTVANSDVLVKLFERIESFFERLKVYTGVPPSPAVTDALAKIMAEVLSFLALATKGIKQGRMKTFVKKLAGMNDLEDALQRFGELEQRELLTGVAQVASDTTALKDVVKETKDDAEETKAMVKNIANKMDAGDWEDMLRKLQPWLSPPDPSTNYNIGLRDLHEETATWFLEDAIFQEWRLNGSLLWIHGKLGSGKSTLCSAIIQHIISLSGGGSASVAYFYFDFRDENKKHLHDLLSSLMVQFAAQSIPCCDIISRLYSAHGKGTQKPSDEVLINCLTDMLSTTTQHPIYIIVDALDECPNTSGVRCPRQRVLSLIKDLVNLRLPNLRICATSRPETDIRNRLEPLTSRCISLHDQASHKDDIDKYIGSEVDVIAHDNRWRDDDKKLVIKTLSEKADGMFRWVFCQLEMLRLCLRSNVRHFLNELPDTLDKTYERILKDIHKTNRSYAHRLLQCVALAIRPLLVEELALLLTLDPVAIEGEVPTLDTDWGSEDQEQEMLSACPNLITIVGPPYSRVVQFSHFSVKEFLTSDRLAAPREDISHYHILPDVAHTTLARASLGVSLSLKDLRYLRLFSYPVRHWVDHALVGKVSASVMHMMKTLFDSDKPHFAAWIQAYTMETPLYPHWCTGALKPLYFAALWGFYDLVDYLVMKHPQDINFIHHSGGCYPLVAALENGHMQIAELLLQHGANVDMRGVDFRGWREWQEQTPLHNAIGWSNDSMATAVEFLLKHGADVNARQKDLSTPLHLATARGYFDVAQMLLKHGADVNSTQQNNLSTPLHLAAARGDFDVAQMLLQCGADVNPKNSSSDTPLQLVSFRPNLVLLLLEHGAEVNSGHRTALHRASHSLDPETVRLLVKHGANVNVQDGDGYTPLYHVLRFHNKHEDRFGVAQLLIERGADVNTTQGRWGGHTLLCSASRSLDLESVQFLLSHGADVNATNLPECRWYCSPVHAVLLPEGEYKHLFKVAHLVRCGADVNTEEQSRHTVTPLHSLQLKLLRILLDHGANIRGEDSEGQTLFHRVFELGHFCQDIFDLIQILGDHGVDVNTTHKNHGTLLHLASYRVDLKSVRFLLGLGTNVNAEVEHWKGRTPLHQLLGSRDCSVGGRFSIARLLVERGANLYARDKDDSTPLHLACHIPAKGLNLVRFFLDHGANVNAEDKQGRTPLHRVLESRQYSHKENFSVAQLLVDRGVDVNARDKNKETALHFASQLSDPKLVQMLLIQGANVNSEDNKGRTPLHRLSESWNGSDEERLDTARLLVVHGANVNAQDESEATPLHLASAFRKLILVRFFLDNGVNANVEDKLGQKPLHQVAGSDSYRDDDASHFDIAQLLMERGADVKAQDKSHVTPLHLASYQLKPKLVLLFLDHGANTNAEDDQGRTPLYRVVQDMNYSYKDRFTAAQLLIEHGADVNIQDKSRVSPLHLASQFLKTELVQFFLDHGANPNAENARGWTPLHLVVLERYGGSEEDRFEAARLLIAGGADVNARSKNNRTPLHLVSYRLKLKLVRLFLDHEANANAEDTDGSTPLHRLVQENSGSEEDCVNTAQLLIARGADVNAPDKCDYETPLHLASYLPKFKLVRFFLDHGANANAEDAHGNTPLHRVLENEDYADKDTVCTITQLLLDHGADANTPNDNHETPLHLASRHLSLPVAWILLKHGADQNVTNKEGKTPFQLLREIIRERARFPYDLRERRTDIVALMGLLYDC